MSLQTLLQEQKKELGNLLHGFIASEQNAEKYPIIKEGEAIVQPEKLELLLTTAVTKGYEFALEEVLKLQKSYWNGHGEGIMVIYPEDIAHLKETI